MTSEKVIIEANDLCFSYGHTPVLIDATLKIYEKEFIGIIGPNGGGKTTFLKLLMGFLQPSSGTLTVTQSKEHPHSIAYVPQSTRFDKEFPISVEEVILSGLLSKLPWYGRFHTAEKIAAHAALEKVGLLHLINAPFGSLSGGQAQRVLIARAVVSQPQLLLLDEPTASVDNQAEADIYEILKELQSNMTILMVTHDLRAALEQVNRVVCIQKQVSIFQMKDICEHFALGLYHFPLQQTSLDHSRPAHFR